MTGSVAEIVTPDSGVTKTSYPITDKPIGHPPRLTALDVSLRHPPKSLQSIA